MATSRQAHIADQICTRTPLKEVLFDPAKELFDGPAATTWGTIMSIEPVGASTKIVLNDTVNRAIKVRGLRIRSGMSELRIGSMTYFFGLERTGSGRGWNGRPFHPHAFHEIGADPQSRSAWTTVVFSAR